MQAAGMTLKKEDYTVRVPRSQRGGEVVEPLVREQWFVRMQPLAQPALQVPTSSPLTFSYMFHLLHSLKCFTSHTLLHVSPPTFSYVFHSCYVG